MQCVTSSLVNVTVSQMWMARPATHVSRDTSTSLLKAALTAAALSSPALSSALTLASVPARREWVGPHAASAFPRTTISQQMGVLHVLVLRSEFEAAPIIVTMSQASALASVAQ